MDRDIPALAYIEQQILGRAAIGGSLQSYTKSVEVQYGLESGSLGSGLFWQTRLLALMYALVLFPKEYWKMGQDDPVYQQIEKRWPLSGVSVLTPDEKFGNSVYGFVHRLRNALAHANISFSGDHLEIWNCLQTREVYRARMGRTEAEKFLETVGAIMANRRNRTEH